MSPLWSPPPMVLTNYLAPSGAAFETFPRSTHNTLTFGPASGVLTMAAIALPAGLSVGRIAFCTGSSGLSSPTHCWFALYDQNRVQLATTADQLTAAWAATTVKSLVIATVAAGAASSFTTTYTGLYYVGVGFTASTAIPLAGNSCGTGAASVSPILTGTSDTGQLTPPAFPKTAGAITALGTIPYAYVGA